MWASDFLIMICNISTQHLLINPPKGPRQREPPARRLVSTEAQRRSRNHPKWGRLVYLSKSGRFCLQKRDRLIFDKNHEGYLMLFHQFLMIQKKLGKGARKSVLDQSNGVVMFWRSKTTSITRKCDRNTSRLCCNFHISSSWRRRD